MTQCEPNRSAPPKGEGCELSFSPVGKHDGKTAQCLLIDDTRLVFTTNIRCTPGHALAIDVSPRNGRDPKFTAFAEVSDCQTENAKQFRVTALIRAVKSD